MANQSESSKFVERFVRLTKKGPDQSAVKELYDVVTKMSPHSGFGMSAQEEAALRLKPTKAFKRACAFMGSEAAVSRLLSLTTKAPEDPQYTMLFMGLLLKMTTIPSFAGQVGTHATAAVLFDFQSAHLSKAVASTRKRIHGPWTCVEWWDSVLMYLNLVINLVKGSEQFANEALRLRLFHKLLELLPMKQRPFLVWAGTDELKAVASALAKVAVVIMELCLSQTRQFPFAESEADFLSRWVDSYLDFAHALGARLRQCTSDSEAQEPLDDMTGPLVRLAAYIESLEHYPDRCQSAWPEKIARALFAPARLESFQKCAQALAKSERWGELGALAVRQFAGLSLLSDESGSSWSSGQKDMGAFSVESAAAMLKELKGAANRKMRMRALTQLEEETKKLRFTEAQLAQSFVRQLAVHGCFPALADVLERENLSGGKISEGVVGPAIQSLTSLAFAFKDASETYFPEMAQLAPRLLTFAQRASEMLTDELLTCLLDVLFACYEMAPDQKWAARLELADLLMAVSEKSGSSSRPSFASWGYLSDLITILAEPTLDVKKMMARSQVAEMSHQQHLDTWKDILSQMRKDVFQGKVHWGPEVSTEKVMGSVLETLRKEASCFMSPRSPSQSAARALLYCCWCAPEADLDKEASKHVGRVVSCLCEGFKPLAAAFRLSREQQALVINDRAQFNAWFRAQQVVASLACYLDVLLKLPSRDELWDEVACNGGVDLAADVLRLKNEGVSFVSSETMVSEVADARASSAMLANLRTLHRVAEMLWKELSQKYGLMKCAYQDCKGVLFETQKNTFRKCGACGLVRYCSKECQALHWKKEHKALCKRQKEST